MSDYVLEARGITKTFPGVRALNNVDFAVKAGEVHALVGENGAGKSTLMMVLGGIYQPDAGEIFINDSQVSFQNARDAIKKGIGIVFQELSLVQQLSVAENIYFNRQPTDRFGFVDKKKLYQQTVEMLASFDIKEIEPNTIVRDLSIANQQVVEILKAISEEPQIIVLDEPTSSLTEVEVKQLFSNIKKLKNKGISFIYISHHLSEIFEIADTVTVLRDGQNVITRPVHEIDEDYIISNMVGRSIMNIYGHREADAPIGEVIFEGTHLTRKDVFIDVSFTVRKGEIVGFSGLVGAGRTEVGRAIFGADPLDSGEIVMEGEKLTITSSSQAIQKGIAYMTEDRKKLGLYLLFSVQQNVGANRLLEFTQNGFVQDGVLQKASEQAVKEFNIATPSIQKLINQLSGGNQQKVLLAEWISTQPKLLIVDEPTRGVDVGAKCEIYQILRKLVKERGCGIMMISSDLPEILGMSDRIVVMKDGRVVGELPGGGNSGEKDVMNLAAGSDS
ncbi:MAG: sugar ABC transporter ATP-binding protein [Flexilinea sp.]